MSENGCYVDRGNWMACVRQILYNDKYMGASDVLELANEMCSYRPATPYATQIDRIRTARFKMYGIQQREVWEYHNPHASQLHAIENDIEQLIETHGSHKRQIVARLLRTIANIG